MTDPATAIKRQVDELIQLQIRTLQQSATPSTVELSDYHQRSAQIKQLFAELDRTKPLPPLPAHKARARVHPSL